jgi:energy-converting hydrogenase Eha subunit H
MRRFPLLVLAALLLSGCGVLTKQELKPVPKTLTHGRFVYLADRVSGVTSVGPNGP